jgi:hypothetical protein
MTLLFAGSQDISCEDEGNMQMALYLLGKSVGNYNLEIATDEREIFVFRGEKTQIKDEVLRLQPKTSKLKFPAPETRDFSIYSYL